jgi:small subunit ribosomal protein S16
MDPNASSEDPARRVSRSTFNLTADRRQPSNRPHHSINEEKKQMSVTIRLRRMGAKAQPTYRLVVTDSRNARDGRFIETIGYYNPRRTPADIRLDETKVLAWLDKGATPSDTVRSLLRKGGLWTRFTKGGAVPAERRQSEAARKERASARRTERRKQAKAGAPRAKRAAAKAEPRKSARKPVKKTAPASRGAGSEGAKS